MHQRGKRLCLHCGERRSLYRHRGRVRADRHHTLCFRCYRAYVNRTRVVRLAWVEVISAPAPWVVTAEERRA